MSIDSDICREMLSKFPSPFECDIGTTALVKYIPSETQILNITSAGENKFTFSSLDKCLATDREIKETFSHFTQYISKARLERICKNPVLKIDINEVKNEKLQLTNEVLRKIFIAMMNIQKDDIDEIKGSIEDRFDKLMIFKSFKDFEEVIMEDRPKLNELTIDRAKSAGKGLKGLVERTNILAWQHFNNNSLKDNKLKHLSDVEMLTARFADREIPKNSVVHLKDGYFYVDEVFVKGGAYIYVLKDLENKKCHKIVCRGTAMVKKATENLNSGINDILLDMGSMGVKSIWAALLTYLESNDIQNVEILGKSLGGAFAQLLSIMIEGLTKTKVEKLTTFASVGVGKHINTLFKKEVLDKREEENPFKIEIIRSSGPKKEDADFIPTVGGSHLGSNLDNCKRKLYYISNSEEDEYYHPKKTWFFNLLKPLARSFSLAHSRQTTIHDFTWKQITDEDVINEHLEMGNHLERARKTVAYFIHFLTFGYLNGRSFNSYYFRQKKLLNTKKSTHYFFSSYLKVSPTLKEMPRKILQFLSRGFYGQEMH